MKSICLPFHGIQRAVGGDRWSSGMCVPKVLLRWGERSYRLVQITRWQLELDELIWTGLLSSMAKGINLLQDKHPLRPVTRVGRWALASKTDGVTIAIEIFYHGEHCRRQLWSKFHPNWDSLFCFDGLEKRVCPQILEKWKMTNISWGLDSSWYRVSRRWYERALECSVQWLFSLDKDN